MGDLFIKLYRAVGAIVLIAAFLWAVLFSDLAITRHEAFQSNAFDLGYVTQTLWYTAHGQPYRFTTVDGLPVSPEGTLDVNRLHQPPSLLAFHVEPLLALLAPIFVVWPDPRLLLVLQAVALAAAGVATAALARVRLGDGMSAVVFGMAFLLSPSVAAAVLSDFHAVSLAALFFILTLYGLATGRARLAVIAAILTAAGREDATILVAALGAYLFARGEIARRRGKVTPKPADPLDGYRDLGWQICLGSLGWAILAFGAIMPFFNGTVYALLHHERAVGSIFWHRYNWLGASPLVALTNILHDPLPLVGWFGQGEVQAFLATLLLSGGVLALLAPEALLVAVPLTLMDALSSFDWMRSGGAHYSVVLIPALSFAGIEGVRRLGRIAPSRIIRSAALGLVLVAAVANHVWLGASPLAPGLTWPAPGPREQAIEAILQTIPRDASIAATSGIYPHLATRAQAYWFPAVNGADYLAIDVVTSSNPIEPGEVHDRVSAVLASGEYRVAAAAPGFLLLERVQPALAHPVANGQSEIPATFDDFARASADERRQMSPLPDVRFGSDLHLDGYKVDYLPTQTVFGPTAQVTTFWHVDKPLGQALAFDFFPTRRSDGAIIGALSGAAPEPLWYPTSQWQSGETITLTIQLPRARDLQAVGVAVVDPTGNRLPVEASPGAVFWENHTIAAITRFDGK